MTSGSEAFKLTLKKMKYKLDILKCLLPALMLSVASCVTEDIDSCPEEPEHSGNWITLQFIVSEEAPVTRANPAGGEDGNGRENEILSESKIHDVNVFLFANDKGVESDTKLLNAASGKKLAHLYFNLDDPGDGENTLAFEKTVSEDDLKKVVYTVKFLDEVPGIVLPLRNEGKVRFITIANKGKSMKGEIRELSDLWKYGTSESEYSLSSTWSGSAQNVSDYDRFVMTTAYENDAESVITFSTEPGAGTQSKPFLGSTTLERMCARIDVMYANSNVKADESELIYSVGESDNMVHIANMLPVNVMAKPSYLFKKVTHGVPTDWTNVNGHTWGGKETVDNKKIPSNYVLEPNTLFKGNASAENLTSWYGATRTSVVKSSIQNAANGSMGGYYHGDLKTTDSGFESYSKIAVLGYANENTQSPYQYNSNYLTGIVFRAIYQPKKWYKKEDESFTSEEKTDAEWNAMEDKSFTRYQPTATTGMTDEKAKYFYSYEDAMEYSNAHTTDQAILTRFEGGICYYNLWLRHYDDVNDIKSDPHEVYPMQYAIVRNNIYRVGLKFTGPGDPTPTMREPETMQARIFVRKWNLREEKDPLLF